MLANLTEGLGSLSGAALRRMDDATLEAYLATFPGVGVKTARCVMMYSLDRAAFRVDTNCLRLFQNLGVINGRMRFAYAQEPLQALVPADIRTSLFVNAVAHGRETCIPGAEHCDACVIVSLCQNPRVRRFASPNGKDSRS
jgi:endonuclease III